MPRIISGTAKGVLIGAPKGMNTRPTSDRAKEALFSILGDIYVGKKVADLYSGTGSLGLEALSRGAHYCVFIDKDRRAIDAIKNNAKKSKLEKNTLIICMDVNKALGSNDIKEYRYACVFMDPPYNKSLLSDTIEKIYEGDIIDDEGILVVEHSKGEMPPDKIAGFVCTDRRTYGLVNFSFYKAKDIS